MKIKHVKEKIIDMAGPNKAGGVNTAFNGLYQALSLLGISVNDDTEIPIPNGDSGPSEPFPMPDNIVNQLLNKLTVGINSAEQKLNEKNLMIASGNVTSVFDLNVGPLKANTTLSINLMPNPYAANN